mmetsp:Transcript_25106/g.59841  ORF Transcript_25106/g.59841 Transcript_25106/m.59841 type:complete len:210 (-) Transcript_25106:311-940(-)
MSKVADTPEARCSSTNSIRSWGARNEFFPQTKAKASASGKRSPSEAFMNAGTAECPPREKTDSSVPVTMPRHSPFAPRYRGRTSMRLPSNVPPSDRGSGRTSRSPVPPCSTTARVSCFKYWAASPSDSHSSILPAFFRGGGRLLSITTRSTLLYRVRNEPRPPLKVIPSSWKSRSNFPLGFNRLMFSTTSPRELSELQIVLALTASDLA